MTGVDTLRADHEKVTSLSPAEAWKYSGDSRGTAYNYNSNVGCIPIVINTQWFTCQHTISLIWLSVKHIIGFNHALLSALLSALRNFV